MKYQIMRLIKNMFRPVLLEITLLCSIWFQASATNFPTLITETRYVISPPTATPQLKPETSYIATPSQIQFYSFGFTRQGDSLFTEPVDLKIDNTGNLFLLDAARSEIFIFNHNTTQLLARWGRKGRGETELLQPTAIAINNLGEVLIADVGAQAIKVFNKQGNFLRTIIPAVPDGTKGFMPAALTCDHRANIYVADLQRRTILVLDFKGKFLHSLAQRKAETVSFNSPAALFLDKDLFIFIADAENSQIKKFSTTGRLWLTIPHAANVNTAKLKFPLDVKVSPRDNIYVADNGNFRIAIFDQKGKILSELYWRDENNQPLVIPRKLCFDPQGNLFILDQLHRRLLKVSAKNLKF